MTDNSFLELIRKYDGFEYVLGFRGDEDHFIGGRGDMVWYYINKGRAGECRIGELNSGVWSDRRLIMKKGLKEEAAESGSTMAMILERAYFGQAEIAAGNRKPVITKLCERECSHYSFSFGARAYDIMNEYGITVSYSNLDDEAAGFRVRNVFTGESVQLPKMK